MIKQASSGFIRFNFSAMCFISLLLLFTQMFTACSDKDALSACADENSLNYNPEASAYSDCQFPTININPRLLSTLPDEVKESSGLALIDGQLLTQNDKNNSNELYVIDPASGGVKATITVRGTENHDWEDLAQSSEHLFVGDMGNNDGDRKDLQIYKIKRSALNFNGDSEVAVDEVISFRYPAQKSFSPNKDHNFDCETLIYHKGNLYLFSKNRADDNTSLYRIPAREGNYDAELIDTFKAGGRITGAAINNEGQVALIGLNKKKDCFIWLLDDYKGDSFFSGSKTIVNLGPFKYIGQTEGIIYTTPDKLYISSEKTKDVEPRLYSLEL